MPSQLWGCCQKSSPSFTLASLTWLGLDTLVLVHDSALCQHQQPRFCQLEGYPDPSWYSFQPFQDPSGSRYQLCGHYKVIHEGVNWWPLYIRPGLGPTALKFCWFHQHVHCQGEKNHRDCSLWWFPPPVCAYPMSNLWRTPMWISFGNHRNPELCF